MIVVAVGGLFVNLAARGCVTGDHHDDLNGARRVVDIMGDACGSVARSSREC